MDLSLMERSAAELAALVRDGQVSARELAEISLAAIEERNGEINAFIDVDADRTLAEADAVRPGEQAFAGVPIAVKGNVPVEGRLMDYASAYMQGYKADHDAFLVRRLKEAGFVVAGTSNLPEFGILPTTESRLYGPARNPWDTSRTPGGSSGGSAAAVASGMVPLAHGNDGGGSIRIPAACCGLVGLKPSRGRISRGPDLGESPLTAEGVLTTTVADTALLLDVLAGYEVGDATWAPKPAELYSTAFMREPGALRIGIVTANPLDAPVDPEAMRGVEEAAALLGSLGHQLEEATLPESGPEVFHLFSAVFGSWISMQMLHAQMLHGSADPTLDDVEPLSKALRDLTSSIPSYGFLGANAQLQQLARTAIAFFADYDLVLTPALAERPLEIGECNGQGENPMEDFARSGRFTPYTALFNVTGQPAISVPIDVGPDGLPTCVQLVGRPLCEDTLLQVARQIETARPWALRPPARPASASA
jgi:amidase